MKLDSKIKVDFTIDRKLALKSRRAEEGTANQKYAVVRNTDYFKAYDNALGAYIREANDGKIPQGFNSYEPRIRFRSIPEKHVKRGIKLFTTTSTTPKLVRMKEAGFFNLDVASEKSIKKMRDVLNSHVNNSTRIQLVCPEIGLNIKDVSLKNSDDVEALLSAVQSRFNRLKVAQPHINQPANTKAALRTVHVQPKANFDNATKRTRKISMNTLKDLGYSFFAMFMKLVEKVEKIFMAANMGEMK